MTINVLETTIAFCFRGGFIPPLHPTQYREVTVLSPIPPDKQNVWEDVTPSGSVSSNYEYHEIRVRVSTYYPKDMIKETEALFQYAKEAWEPAYEEVSLKE